MTTKDKTVFRHFVKFYMLLLSTTKPGEFRVENLQCLFPLVGPVTFSDLAHGLLHSPFSISCLNCKPSITSVTFLFGRTNFKKGQMPTHL